MASQRPAKLNILEGNARRQAVILPARMFHFEIEAILASFWI
jgi:hypothetical protein